MNKEKIFEAANKGIFEAANKGIWINNKFIRHRNIEKPCYKLGYCPLNLYEHLEEEDEKNDLS